MMNKFEEWANGHGWNIDKTDQGNYRDSGVGSMSAAWLACGLQMALQYEESERQRAQLQNLLTEAYGYTTAATDLLPERIKAALSGQSATEFVPRAELERVHRLLKISDKRLQEAHGDVLAANMEKEKLTARLEQLEQVQEPVAWMFTYTTGGYTLLRAGPIAEDAKKVMRKGESVIPLYTSCRKEKVIIEKEPVAFLFNFSNGTSVCKKSGYVCDSLKKYLGDGETVIPLCAEPQPAQAVKLPKWEELGDDYTAIERNYCHGRNDALGKIRNLNPGITFVVEE